MRPHETGRSSTSTTFVVKRAYAAAETTDGLRVLVDALWPRGLSKDAAKIDLWLKAVAPSTALRKWFGHDPERRDDFRRKYFDELAHNDDAVSELRSLGKRGRVTLLFAAKDVDHNNAVALHGFLTSGRRDR